MDVQLDIGERGTSPCAEAPDQRLRRVERRARKGTEPGEEHGETALPARPKNSLFTRVELPVHAFCTPCSPASRETARRFRFPGAFRAVPTRTMKFLHRLLFPLFSGTSPETVDQ